MAALPPPGLPQTCATCSHRRRVEHDGPAIMVGLVRHYCRGFVSHDPRTGKTDLLPCSYAYDTFCGGGDYRPEFWTRVLRALRITK